MIQWLKRYYDYNHSDKQSNYDPVSRRKGQSLIQDQGTKKMVKQQPNSQKNEKKTLNKENFVANQQKDAAEKPKHALIKPSSMSPEDQNKIQNYDRILEILSDKSLSDIQQLD